MELGEVWVVAAHFKALCDPWGSVPCLRAPQQCSKGVLVSPTSIRTSFVFCLHQGLNQEPSQPSPQGLSYCHHIFVFIFKINTLCLRPECVLFICNLLSVYPALTVNFLFLG